MLNHPLTFWHLCWIQLSFPKRHIGQASDRSAALRDLFKRGCHKLVAKLAGWRSAAASGELSSSEAGPYFCKCRALRHILVRWFSESEFSLGIQKHDFKIYTVYIYIYRHIIFLSVSVWKQALKVCTEVEIIQNFHACYHCYPDSPVLFSRYMLIAASSHGPWYSTLVALSLASSELERASDGAPGVCGFILHYCSFGIWTTAFACRSLFSTFGEK